MLQFLLQLLRYDICNSFVILDRYLWYAMYLPMTAQPILCFFLAVCLYRREEQPLPRACWLLAAVGAVIVLGVLTNDLHFQFKSFPSGVLDDNGQEVSGWLFYLSQALIYGVYGLTYALILKKDLRFVGRRYRWLPLIPFLFGVIYFTIFPLNLGQRLFGARLWNMGEVLSFCIIGTMEAFIQVGMIPANMGYETVFRAAAIPAVILDRKGAPVYQTAAANDPFAENEDTAVFSNPIPGGSIQWAVDLREINGLNRQIEEATQQIETRNAYLAEETRIRRERAELETRNRLYDNISRLVKPQLEQIDELLNSREDTMARRLPRIAVLIAYIKRRSNMELLAAEGSLPASELGSATAESLDYLGLCGVNAACTVSGGEKVFPAEMVIAAYEQIEAIVEQSLDSLSDLVVTLRAEGPSLTVRMLLRSDDFSYEADSGEAPVGYDRRLAITKDRQDLVIDLTLTEGGGRR